MIDWDLGLCSLSIYDADGFLGVALDLYGEQSAGARAFEVLHPFGFISRPADPDVDSSGNPVRGAGALYGYEGEHRGVCIPLTDPRPVLLMPQLKKGGSAQYSQKGSFSVLDGDNGSWLLFVPYANRTKGLALAANVETSGKEAIQLIHGTGMNITLASDPVAGDYIQTTSKSGTVWNRVDDTGHTLSGDLQVEGGAILGGVAGAKQLVTWDTFLAWAAKIEAAFAGKLDGVGTPFPTSFPDESLANPVVLASMPTAKVKAQ